MNTPLKQLALVTGASSGIGLEMARELARKKIDLILVARSKEKLIALQSELINYYGIQVHVITKDLSRVQNAHELYEEIHHNGWMVTILINNAGVGHYGAFTETDLADELNMIELNISSLVVLTKLFLVDMQANQYGKILNMASLLSFMSFPYFSIYAATKAFVLSFTEALSAELKDGQITVTALCPGPTNSNFASTKMTQSNAYRLMKQTSPEEVAKWGIVQLFKGKRAPILGLQNKVIYYLTKFGTRSANLNVNKFMASPSKK